MRNSTVGQLPFGDVVEQGLRDLRQRLSSVPALLVSIGASRLQACGIEVVDPIVQPEIKLYLKLQETFGDAAHSRYNALIRGLVSYERALECAR